MRRPLLPFLALLISTPAYMHGQTADEIIARYAERIGGIEHIRAVQTVRRSGKFYGGGGFEGLVRCSTRAA